MLYSGTSLLKNYFNGLFLNIFRAHNEKLFVREEGGEKNKPINYCWQYKQL